MKSIPTNKQVFSRAKSAVAFLALIILVSITKTSRAELVARWSFDESSGTTAHDSVGGQDGTLSPAGASFVSGGVSGNALQLDMASNGYVSVASSSAFGFTAGDFSIVAWIKTTVDLTNDNAMIVSKHAAYTQNGYWFAVLGGCFPQIGCHDGSLIFGEGEVPTAVYSPNAVNDGVWHQVATVYKPSTGTKYLYVDGALVDSNTALEPIYPNSIPLMIGGASFDGVLTSRYTGLIDEVQLYDKALNASQIQQLFVNPTNTVAVSPCADVQTQLDAANATNAQLVANISALRSQVLQLQARLNGANTTNAHLSAELNKIIQEENSFEAFLSMSLRLPPVSTSNLAPEDRLARLISAIESGSRVDLLHIYNDLARVKNHKK